MIIFYIILRERSYQIFNFGMIFEVWIEKETGSVGKRVALAYVNTSPSVAKSK